MSGVQSPTNCVRDPAFRRVLLRRISELNRPVLPEPAGVPAQLSPLRGVRVVLFDIYGTLLTSGCGEIGPARSDNTSLAQSALQDAGFRCMGAKVGKRALNLLQHWIEKDHKQSKRDGIEYPEVDIREVWESVLRDLAQEGLIQNDICSREISCRQAVERMAVEYECRVNPAWPMPDLQLTLGRLRNTGMKLGVVSNAQFYTPLLLEAFRETGWAAGFFEPQLCAWSYELGEAKPSTRLFRIVLERLADRFNCAPAETLCVGNDMLNDMLPAAHMGCRTALFAGDRKSFMLRTGDTRCAGIAPDLVVTALTQLPDVLQ